MKKIKKKDGIITAVVTIATLGLGWLTYKVIKYGKEKRKEGLDEINGKS